MKKRIMSVILTLAMVMSLVSAIGVVASAEGKSIYVDLSNFEETGDEVYTQVVNGYTIKLKAELFFQGKLEAESATIGFDDGVTKITKIQVHGTLIGFGYQNVGWTESDDTYYYEFNNGSEPTSVTFNPSGDNISGFTIYYKEGSSVSLNKSTAEIFAGNTFNTVTLTATTVPANTPIVWSSSNEGIATVENGVVTGVSEGVATITAAFESDSSTKATCTVTVLPKKTAVDYISPIYKTLGEPSSGLSGTETLSATGYYEITENASEMQIWKDGWYVIAGEDVRYTGGLTIEGNVNVILKDGAKLTVSGAYSAISFKGKEILLTVYGQAGNTGKLVANGAGVGISGADINSFVFNGGIIELNGGSYSGFYGLEDVIFNGGDISATGGYSGAVFIQNILVNAGNATFSGGNGGIGTEKSFTINGGTVEATGNSEYGIHSHGFNINGGKVIAKDTNAVGILILDSEDIDSYLNVAEKLTIKAGASAETAGEIDNPGSFDITAFNNSGYKYVEIVEIVDLIPSISDITSDSGYYAEKADAADNAKEGIIAFTSKFANLLSDFSSYSFGANDKFGIAMFKTQSLDDDGKLDVAVSQSTFDDLKTANGFFYSFVTDIPYSEFGTTVYAKPFAIIGGTTYWGNLTSTTVNANKWLGQKSN